METIIIAFLWRAGGAGWKPFEKNWRRIGVPLVVLLVTFWRGYSEWQAILSALATFAVLRLPLTFFDDSLLDHWFNWGWIWIAGYLLGLVSVITHGWSGFLLALIPSIVQGVSVTLSNIPATAKDWPHEACEILIGCAFSVCLMIPR